MIYSEHVWLMNDSDEATGYVVVGNKCAAVIDTMMGLVNVKEEDRKLTESLPLKTQIGSMQRIQHLRTE